MRYNAQMTSRQVREHCRLSPAGQQMLRHSVEELGLSARAHDKILRVARTIADLSGDESIEEMHLAEAIGYRSLDPRPLGLTSPKKVSGLFFGRMEGTESKKES